MRVRKKERQRERAGGEGQQPTLRATSASLKAVAVWLLKVATRMYPTEEGGEAEGPTEGDTFEQTVKLTGLTTSFSLQEGEHVGVEG